MRACVYVRRGLTMGAAGAKNTSDVSGRCGVTKGLRGRRGIRQSLNSAFSANPRLVSVSFVSSSHSRGGRGGDRGISDERNVEGGRTCVAPVLQAALNIETCNAIKSYGFIPTCARSSNCSAELLGGTLK